MIDMLEGNQSIETIRAGDSRRIRNGLISAWHPQDLDILAQTRSTLTMIILFLADGASIRQMR